jgi:hypothetical protein
MILFASMIELLPLCLPRAVPRGLLPFAFSYSDTLAQIKVPGIECPADNDAADAGLLDREQSFNILDP